MPSFALATAALLFAAAPAQPSPAAGGRGAPAAAAAQDSSDAVLVSADGDAQLELTEEALVFSFTGQGKRRVLREVDPSTVGESAWAADLAGQITERVVRAMRIPFPLSAVHQARADGATVVVEFRGRDEATRDDSRQDTRLQFDVRSAAAARAFVARLERRRHAGPAAARRCPESHSGVPRANVPARADARKVVLY